LLHPVIHMRQKFPLFLFFLLFFAFACKSKKKVSLSGEDPIEVSDFIEAFQPLELPYQLEDSAVVNKKPQDSLWISYKVFTQFVPDSVLAKVYGKEKKIKIFPVGKVGKDQNFLFARTVSANRWTALVVCFDKKNNFIASMPALQPDANPATRQYFSIDPRLTMTKLTARKNPNGTTSEAKDVFVLNPQAKLFQLIMTVNPDAKNIELINPIDTFSRKNKFSGDYVRDAKNLVSIRDNKKTSRFTFFIHFEGNEGECTGELKGEASFTSATEAVYKSSGDPCHLQFQFTSSSVTIMEQNCGSHRGPGCLFEGTYPKKKEPKKSKKKK
jgi:hypothetical protein